MHFFDRETSSEAPAEPVASDDRSTFAGYEGQPVLVAGDGGEHVVALAARLAELGYETPVSAGTAAAILTDEVYAAVEAFRRDHDVTDELTRDGAIVGPATWAALARAR